MAKPKKRSLPKKTSGGLPKKRYSAQKRGRYIIVRNIFGEIIRKIDTKSKKFLDRQKYLSTELSKKKSIQRKPIIATKHN